MGEDEFDLKALIAKSREAPERIYRRGYQAGYLAAVRDVRRLVYKTRRVADALDTCFRHGRDTLSDWVHGPEGFSRPPRID